MAKFLSGTQLYEAVQQKSAAAKEVLYVCSPRLELGAHEVFSQETVKHVPADVRFIFPVYDAAVKAGEVDPYEVEFLMEHFPNGQVRSVDGFSLNVYVFDDSALVTSASFVRSAYEGGGEAGVLLEGSEAAEARSFFCLGLWEKAKPVHDVRKLKKLWKHSKRSISSKAAGKSKPSVKVVPWADDSVSTWYFSVFDASVTKVMRRVQKEANWPRNLELVSDIGPVAFRQLRLGDNVFLADLSKNRNEVAVHFARVYDKARVETDVGDLHFAYETRKTYPTQRSVFYETLKSVGVPAKGSEIQLTQEQVNLLTSAFSSGKKKKRHRLSR